MTEQAEAVTDERAAPEGAPPREAAERRPGGGLRRFLRLWSRELSSVPRSPVLSAGYLLAVPGTLLVPRIVRERWTAAFAALELGTALIVLGWLMRRRWIGVVINTAAFFGFAAYWTRGGRRRGLLDRR